MRETGRPLGKGPILGGRDAKLGDPVDELEQHARHLAILLLNLSLVAKLEEPAADDCHQHDTDQAQGSQGDGRAVVEEQRDGKEREDARDDGGDRRRRHLAHDGVDAHGPRPEIAGGVPGKELGGQVDDPLPHGRLEAVPGAVLQSDQRDVAGDLRRADRQGYDDKHEDDLGKLGLLYAGDNNVEDVPDGEGSDQRQQPSEGADHGHHPQVGADVARGETDQVKARQRPVGQAAVEREGRGIEPARNIGGDRLHRALGDVVELIGCR